MRGSIGRLASSSKNNSNFTKQGLISWSPFSSFAGGGGRGRGRGGVPSSDFSDPQFTPQAPGKSVLEEEADAAAVYPSGGLGHGRGKPIASDPTARPLFYARTPPEVSPSIGRGRITPPSPISHPQQSQSEVNPSMGRGRTTQPPPVSSSQDSQSGVSHSLGRGRTTQPPHTSPPQDAQSGISSSFGRGQTTQPPQPSSSLQEQSQSERPKTPIFFRREDAPQPLPMQRPTQFSNLDRNSEEGILPPNLIPGLPGLGRGKPVKLSGSEERPADVNRHLRPRQDSVPSRRGETPPGATSQSQPKVGREDAAKRAMGILSKYGSESSGDGGRGRGPVRGGFRGGRGGRGRGGRGFRGGRGGRGRGESRDSEDDSASGLYLGDNADGERLAQRLGPEKMAMLTEAFEEMSYRVLPSPVDDAYLDAMHTNNMIEYEPEYLVEFDNPDIDEKPPIPLRDALEKMKPFLMAYEGIQSQQEWEEIIEELMGRVPQMKELIDHYCGPDRVTAKQQQQELERVAKTLPENVPSSVKRFTDRAVLSLQSNPGWGWDKKCQFMDKVVWEVSQQYK